MAAKRVKKFLVEAAIAAKKLDRNKSEIKFVIGAGLANEGPPLGQKLSERGVNAKLLCKEFNDRTANYKEGIPLPVRIHVRPDRSYDLTIHNPTTCYLLKCAAGIKRGTHDRNVTAGKITLKHVYEIAKIKSQDPVHENIPLEEICNRIIGQALNMGIETVKTLDAEEYGQFLEERRKAIAAWEAEVEAKNLAKKK